MKKLLIMSIIAASTFALWGCGESGDPETLGAEYGKLQYQCDDGKNKEACEKAKKMEKRIENLSDEDKVIAGLKALEVVADMAAEDLGKAIDGL